MGSVVNSERMPNIVSVPMYTQSTAINLPGPYIRKRSRLKAVRLNDQAGIAASNSNYLTVTLQDNAVPPNVYASFDTRAANQGALTALVAALMTLGGGTVLGTSSGALATTVLGDSTNPEVDIPAGTQLLVQVTPTGTIGVTYGIMELELYPL